MLEVVTGKTVLLCRLNPAEFTCLLAQATKTYTAHDYADILDHLIKHWDINSLTGAALATMQCTSQSHG